MLWTNVVFKQIFSSTRQKKKKCILLIVLDHLFVLITESLADAKVSAQQQWVYEGPQRRNVQQINATNIMLKSTFSGLQRCRWQYWSTCIFIRLAVIASQICEIPRNSQQIRTYSTSRSSTVIDLGANWKRICNFLLVLNSNSVRISYRFQDIDAHYSKIAGFPSPFLFDAP